MEFVNQSEVADLLQEYGYEEVPEGDERVYLTMPDQDGVVHLHFAADECTADPRDGAKAVATGTEALPELVSQVLHRLNLAEVLLIPVGRWRTIFDAVAFSMATNESWQEVDAAATVELNRRDPLLCGPAEFHIVVDLIRALLSDAEGASSELMLTPPAVPVIIGIVPDGAVRISVGTRALADQITDLVPA